MWHSQRSGQGRKNRIELTNTDDRKVIPANLYRKFTPHSTLSEPLANRPFSGGLYLLDILAG